MLTVGQSQVLVRGGGVYQESDITWLTLTLLDLSLSCHVPGLLVTAGTDDTVKFWDVQVSKAFLPTKKSFCDGAVGVQGLYTLLTLHCVFPQDNTPVFLLSREMHMVNVGLSC